MENIVVVDAAVAVLLHLDIVKMKNLNLVKTRFNSYRHTTLTKPYASESEKREQHFVEEDIRRS